MALILYLIFIAGSIKIAMGVIAGISGLVIFAAGIAYVANLDNYSSSEETRCIAAKIIKKSLYLVIPAFILATLIPTSEQAAVLYLVPKVIENTQVQEISKDGLKILSIMTQNYLLDLEASKKDANNKTNDAETMQEVAHDLVEMHKIIVEEHKKPEENK